MVLHVFVLNSGVGYGQESVAHFLLWIEGSVENNTFRLANSGGNGGY